MGPPLDERVRESMARDTIMDGDLPRSTRCESLSPEVTCRVLDSLATPPASRLPRVSQAVYVTVQNIPGLT